jgi:hypothetical protein
MSRRRVVIAIGFSLVVVAVAAALVLNGLLPVSNGQAQSAGVQTGRVVLTPEEEVSQLLQQTRAVLTKVDDALEYPMTASERRRSD